MSRLLLVLAALLVFASTTGLVARTAPPPNTVTYAHYAVAADTAQASQAGAEVLAAGGTAADAAAATMLALGVVSPASSGLGGGGFATYYRASDHSVTFIDFREKAPAAATADMFAGQPDGEGPASRRSQIGGLSSGVPGEPAGIAELLSRFGGGVTREVVVAPAIRLATDGYAPTPYLNGMVSRFGSQMRRDPLLREWLDPHRDQLRPLIKNVALARTLRELARSGADPFYRGAIAREIVRANNRNGGNMTAADLAAYQVAIREPLVREMFGLRFVTAPPPSAGGYTLLASLDFVERVLGTQRRSAATVLHAMAESFKGPYVDRARYFGDPDQVQVPLDRLLDEQRLAARAARFHPTLATDASSYALPLEGPPSNAQQHEGGGTSHFCVVDAQGNVASVTTTVNLPFGARYTAAGIVMNDQMDDFASAVGVANAFSLPGGELNLPAPGKRPVSTMTPTIVLDGDRPVMCVGAAGGSRIVTATAQVAYRTLVQHLALDEAMAHPRIHHQGMPTTLSVETDRPFSADVLAELALRGHTVANVGHSAVSQAIHITPEGLVAACDPRKGGLPAGE